MSSGSKNVKNAKQRKGTFFPFPDGRKGPAPGMPEDPGLYAYVPAAAGCRKNNIPPRGLVRSRTRPYTEITLR